MYFDIWVSQNFNSENMLLVKNRILYTIQWLEQLVLYMQQWVNDRLWWNYKCLNWMTSTHWCKIPIQDRTNIKHSIKGARVHFLGNNSFHFQFCMLLNEGQLLKEGSKFFCLTVEPISKGFYHPGKHTVTKILFHSTMCRITCLP